jgi:hypothetical protein
VCGAIQTITGIRYGRSHRHLQPKVKVVLAETTSSE